MSYSDPPPPPPAYGAGQPAYGGAPANHPKGTTILILGILSLVCCGIFTGIPAIIMGRSALREIDAQPNAYSNRGTVFAGYILGIIATVLTVLGIVIWVILLATGAATFEGNFESG